MGTILQNNNVIDGVNRETVYTQTMQNVNSSRGVGGRGGGLSP